MTFPRMPSNFDSLTRFERHKQLLKLQRMLNLELWDEFNLRKHEPRKLGEYLVPFIDGLINSLTEYGYRFDCFDYGGSTDFESSIQSFFFNVGDEDIVLEFKGFRVQVYIQKAST